MKSQIEKLIALVFSVLFLLQPAVAAGADCPVVLFTGVCPCQSAAAEHEMPACCRAAHVQAAPICAADAGGAAFTSASQCRCEGGLASSDLASRVVHEHDGTAIARDIARHALSAAFTPISAERVDALAALRDRGGSPPVERLLRHRSGSSGLLALICTLRR